MTDRKLRIKQRSGYFCGMFGCNAAYSMVNTFLLMLLHRCHEAGCCTTITDVSDHQTG